MSFRRTYNIKAFGHRSSSLKLGALLAVMFMLSTVLNGVGSTEPRALASASAGGFSTPVMMNDNKASDQAEPVIAAIPNGGLFAAWQDLRSGGEDIYTSRSTNNGSTFLANRRADDSSGTTSKQWEPSVAVSTNGTIFLVWQDNRRSTFDYDIFFTKSFDGGATFSRNVRVDDPTVDLSWQERPSVAVTNSGTIYVAWTDDRTDHLRIRGAYSTDMGATFSASKEIVPTGSTSGQDEVVLASSGNRLFAAFMDNLSGVPHPYFCVSNNGGKTFSNPERLDNTRDPGPGQRGISIAAMPGGGIAAAWEDNRSGNWDIYMSLVSARGVVMTSSIRVDDDTTGSFQSSPSIAVDPLGNVYVAWLDERDMLYAIRVAFLQAGSSAFNSSIAVSSPGSNDVQRAPSIMAPQPGLVFVAWQDDRLNTDDVYCASAYFPWLFGLSLLDGWNLISIPSDVTGLRASTLGLRSGDTVASWNDTTQRYDRMYIVGLSPPPYDFALSPSTGYWVNTAAHEVIKLKASNVIGKITKRISVPAGGGWATIGFESLNTSRSASDISKMLDTPSAIGSVAGYDALTNSYLMYNAGLPFTDFALAPGQAYLCWVTTNTTLTYSP